MELDSKQNGIKNVNVGVLTVEVPANATAQSFLPSIELITNYDQTSNNPFISNRKDWNVLEAAVATCTSRVPDLYYVDGSFGHAYGDVNPVNYGIADCVAETGYYPSSVFSLGCGRYVNRLNTRYLTQFKDSNKEVQSLQTAFPKSLNLLNPSKAHSVEFCVYIYFIYF